MPPIDVKLVEGVFSETQKRETIARLGSTRRGPFWSERRGALWGGRWLFALTLVASVLVSAFGLATPARAEPPPDPAARLQVVLEKIIIADDGDWFGSGELEFLSEICTVDLSGGCTAGDRILMGKNFSADTGDQLDLNRVVPQAGDSMDNASVEAGLSVFAGRHYRFHASMFDRDVPGGGDYLGEINLPVDAEHEWGIGTYRIGSDSYIEADNGVRMSKFTLLFAIRRTPLPDLQVHGFRFIQLDAGGQAICAQIENIGERPSVETPMTERVNGTFFREYIVPALAAGQTTQACVGRSELPTQGHGLGFFIDEEHQLAEMDETNNINILSVRSLAASAPAGSAPASATGAEPTSTPATATPSPESKPSNGRPDLLVRAIRVNGQPADSKNACKDGAASVAVVVKNGGNADAPGVAVRLSVDGNTLDQSVDALHAGEEREVTFGNVTLKKGEHTLKSAVRFGPTTHLPAPFAELWSRATGSRA